MQRDEGFDQGLVAGAACALLIADPKSWINRRVEAVELLSQEETRRRVSIDFSLTADQIEALRTRHGVVVPLSALHKEARRNFDLRDEGGRSVPVLGRADNGWLAQVALLAIASEVLAADVSDEDLEQLAADFRTVVFGDEDEAYQMLAGVVEQAEAGDPVWGAVWQNAICRELLLTLASNYVLFAVIESSTPQRRVLKYSYGEYFDLPSGLSRLGGLVGREAFGRIASPDSRSFLIGCPGAWRSVSFHMEIAIPEELKVRTAFLVDFDLGQRVGEIDCDVDRAALYANHPLAVRRLPQQSPPCCGRACGPGSTRPTQRRLCHFFSPVQPSTRAWPLDRASMFSSGGCSRRPASGWQLPLARRWLDRSPSRWQYLQRSRLGSGVWRRSLRRLLRRGSLGR